MINYSYSSSHTSRLWYILTQGLLTLKTTGNKTCYTYQAKNARLLTYIMVQSTQPMQTLFTNCVILPSAGAALIPDAFLLTEGDTITDFGAMAQVPQINNAEMIDCKGRLLMPGLVNAHNHCAMTLFRGLADDLPLAVWLHEHIFPAEAEFVTAEMVYWSTRLAAAEMILSGTTCVADAYFFSDSAAEAIRDSGMRGVICHGVLDFPTPSTPDPSKSLDIISSYIKDWKNLDPLITPGIFAHSPYTCSPQTLVGAKKLARDEEVPFFIHIAETRDEQNSIISPQGPSPLKHLANLGLLDSNTTLVHAAWLSDDDIAQAAVSGAKVITCPQSNLKLGSGIAPVAKMLQAGIAVGLGTDGCASNNSLDMFREMGSLSKIHKLMELDATAVTAGQSLAAATRSGAQILGFEKSGEIKKGCKADLIVIDTQLPHLTPLYNPDILVYGAQGGDVVSTMIDGRLVMHERKILSFDLNETIHKVNELAKAIQSTG